MHMDHGKSLDASIIDLGDVHGAWFFFKYCQLHAPSPFYQFIFSNVTLNFKPEHMKA